jgi:glutamyl-tRNA reductase
MALVLVGINHKSAPIEVRERLAFSDEACVARLNALIDGDVIREGLILSTCNRVEVLVAAKHELAEEISMHLVQFLCEASNLRVEELNLHAYTYIDDEAVRHLFKVASSLDSMVVGEPQILGQVRKAYALANEAGTSGRILNRLLPHAFHVAKRARNETDIASSAVSISYVAVELGRKIFDELAGRTVLLIGAGETAELSARHLRKAGVSRVLIANRTERKAERLAQQFSGEVVDFNHLAPSLAEADIVICSTNAPDYLVTAPLVRAAQAQCGRSPSVFIDLSLPRNIDPQIAEIANLFVFDIDDLQAVIDSNLKERVRETARAEAIVESELKRFQDELRSLAFGPAIGAVRDKMQQIARAELLHQRGRLGRLTTDQEKAIEALLISTVNKLAHPVISQLRRLLESGVEENLQAWRKDFELDGPVPESKHVLKMFYSPE